MKLTNKQIRQIIKEELNSVLNEGLTPEKIEYFKVEIDAIRRELNSGTPDAEVRQIVIDYFSEAEYFYDHIVCYLLKNNEIDEQYVANLDPMRSC